MTLTYPISSPAHRSAQLSRIWLPYSSESSLFELFHASVKSSLVKVHSQAEATFQLLDWRSKSPLEHFSSAIESEQRDKILNFPSLIVIDENTDLSSCFDPLKNIDISVFEFVNVVELNTTILDVRIKKLVQSKIRKPETHLPKDKLNIILDAMMKYSNDWLVVKSLDHRFLFASGKFCRATGKSIEEILGKDDLEVGTSPELVFGKPGTDWKGYWALDKEVTDSGMPLANPPLLLVDEDLHMYESMDKVPLRDQNGDVFALIVCVYRFTMPKANDSNLQHEPDGFGKSANLWERKQGLSDCPALFAASYKLKKAEELKNESEMAFIAKNRFIATASHDLRQPLHALGLYIGALESSVNNDGQYLIEKVNSCVSALNELLTSLLDISRLDANVVSTEMSDFKITELLQSLQSECLSIARGKSLDICCVADESFVYSDQVLLRRVIRNLMINSINHTAKGRITLTTTQVGNHVEIVVADTGIGIHPAQQKVVFDEFAKVGSSSVEIQQGLGLGLSIVKRLCALLNIGLRLESEIGKGTRVTLAVPLGSHIAQAVEDKSKPTTTIQSCATDSLGLQKKVLIIDDDATVCEAVQTILVNTGYQVESATSLEDALTLLENSSINPDAMLVDFRLSDETTGLDAIDVVAEALGTSIPAVVITGDTTNDGLKEITGSGYRYLHKPVDVTELLNIVKITVNTKAEA